MHEIASLFALFTLEAYAGITSTTGNSVTNKFQSQIYLQSMDDGKVDI